MDSSDQQLIANYLAGDEKSLGILIKRYLKPIYNFAYRYVGNSQDAKDVAQEVFMKVWRNLKNLTLKRVSSRFCKDFYPRGIKKNYS